MGVKAAVFDYGGVICFFPSSENTAELGRLTGLDGETFRELNGAYRGEWDRGACDGVDFYRMMLSTRGIFPDVETLLHIAQIDMDGWKRVNEGTVRLMRDIKAAGFNLGILSNMPFDFLQWARKNIAVFKEADTSVFSCEQRLIKPEPGIYKALKEKLNCEYHEIVFFDDLEKNVAKAEELGILGFLWNGPEEARKILKSLGGGFSTL
ncbi:MAG: HAD family phosphatase [Treponema sp.]|nr:HAD family phosphatase [Treponema sp.]